LVCAAQSPANINTWSAHGQRIASSYDAILSISNKRHYTWAKVYFYQHFCDFDGKTLKINPQVNFQHAIAKNKKARAVWHEATLLGLDG
jgi:hypothetical protein